MKIHKPTNAEKVIRYALENNGFTELEGVKCLSITSGRNYIAEVENLLNIKLDRPKEETADGEHHYNRYTVPDRQTAETLIKWLNGKSALRGVVAYSEKETAQLLQHFE